MFSVCAVLLIMVGVCGFCIWDALNFDSCVDGYVLGSGTDLGGFSSAAAGCITTPRRNRVDMLRGYPSFLDTLSDLLRRSYATTNPFLHSTPTAWEQVMARSFQEAVLF